MGGPFDRSGINQADQESEGTPVEGTQVGRGVIFGPTDDITVQPADIVEGTVQDQGVILGPSLETEFTNVDPQTGEISNPGVIFGNELITEITESGGSGTGDVTNAQLTAERNARIAADTDLQNQIDAEEVARQEADTALSDRINAIDGGQSSDVRTAQERARSAIFHGYRDRQTTSRVNIGGIQRLATRDWTLQDGSTITETLHRVNNVLDRRTYQGSFINSIIAATDGATGNSLIRTFDRSGSEVEDIWSFGFLSGALVLSFNLINGEITETEDPNNEWSVNSITGEITNTSSAYTINNVNGEIAEV